MIKKKYACLISVVFIFMFNLLQVEPNKYPNPYGWWPLGYRAAHGREIEIYGSELVSEVDQKKWPKYFMIWE